MSLGSDIRAAASATAWMGKEAAGAAYGLGKMGYAASGPMYQAANAFSKVGLGASIPQMGAALGIGLGAYSLISDDPVGGLSSGIQSVKTMGGMMGDEIEMASRPTYGSTAFQQSVQGLTFGLHSRRTR